MQPLIDSLFELSLVPRGTEVSPLARTTIVESGDECWADALTRLSPHKVFSLLAYQLERAGLLESVPERARAQLTEFRAEVQRRNALLLLTVARLLRLAKARGESAVLLKGILLADSYYPDPAARPMSDIDLLAVRGRDEALFALLADAGFRPSFHHTVQDHSVTLMNREGVFCDAHRSLPAFDSEPFHKLVRDIELKRVRGVRALGLEPNAMVAHLATHMHGHARELGLVLLWVADLGFVLPRVRAELDLLRIRRLIRGDGAFALLLRLLRLLAGAGVDVPEEFLRAGRALPPITVQGVLRQRRLMPWGLPRPLGWARLLAHSLHLHRSDRPEPRIPDLLLWPYDELSTYFSEPLAKVAAR